MSGPESDDVYEDEPAIGHVVKAVYEEGEAPEWLREAAKTTGIEPRDRPDYVHITEADVDWDETRSLKINVEQLREVALQFTDLEEP